MEMRKEWLQNMEPKTRLVITKEKWVFLPRFLIWVSSEGDVRTWWGHPIQRRMSSRWIRVRVKDRKRRELGARAVPVHYLVALAFTPLKKTERLVVDFLTTNLRDVSLKNLNIAKIDTERA